MSKVPRVEGFQTTSFQSIIPGFSYTISFSAASATSPAVESDTDVVRVFSTEDCFLKFGSSPTATTSDMFLPAGIVEYFGMNPGDKIAVIRSVNNGLLYVTEGD